MRWRISLYVVAALLIVGSTWLIFGWGWQVHRVQRTHRQDTPAAYQFLTKKVLLPLAADEPLTRRQAEEDLDELEWLLENRYAYLHLRDVDYRAALDAIRASAAEGTRRSTLALQIAKLLCLFGDGCSSVAEPSPDDLCPGFLPFLIEEVDGRLVALKADRSGFVDDRCPFLVALDGLAVSEWLAAAETLSPKGSPPSEQQQTRRNLRYIGWLRAELDRPPAPTVTVAVESQDWQQNHRLQLDVLREKSPDAAPAAVVAELADSIGYIRLAATMQEDAKFLAWLGEAMERVRPTRGLIIDVRGYGGSHVPLMTLLPYFLDPSGAPRVVNVAAPRARTAKSALILKERRLYPPDQQGWTAAERLALQDFRQSFKPAWSPPDVQPRWHYCVVSPAAGPPKYHYAGPVVILMDAASCGAADIFLGALEGLPNVTVLGTPSGGGSDGCCDYRLHHSGIQVRLASMVSYGPTGELYGVAGIQPDVLVKSTLMDLGSQNDPQLFAAQELLKSKFAPPP
ncbi:MAG: S41 family peptidase [Phycisphaerae bacterium]|jgi:hypothetical protein